jgi:tetratricopeptide (TPR) repeat protein
MPSKGLLSIPLLCAAALAQAQPTQLEAGYRQMYDLQFAAAHRSFQEWERLHPNDPMGPVSEAAAFLFAEFDRLHILQSEFFIHDQHFMTDHKLTPDPQVKRQFEAALDAARNLAARSPNDKNSMFASLLADGLYSDYLALIDKRYVSSFKEMKTARQQAERLIGADPQYYDAWIAVGVENYMLSVKPVFLRFFLRMAGAETDRALGIEKLRLTAAKGHYLAPFARLLLGVAALRGGDVAQARDILVGLTQEFPHNPLYRQELARLSPSAARIDTQ